MSVKCSFCQSDDVTLISGYNYCKNCVKKLEKAAIHNILHQHFPTVGITKIVQICHEMFDSENYDFSMVPKLYTINPRNDSSVAEYIVSVFRTMARRNHPVVYKRIMRYEDSRKSFR